MDANEATLAKVTNRIEIIWHKESNVNRKQDAGGQSQRRFERIREEQLKQWNKEVYQKLKENYGGHGIVLAGPGDTKIRLRVYFEPPVDSKVISVVDVGYTCSQGVLEGLDKAVEAIRNNEFMENKKLIERFKSLLYKDPRMVEYGPNVDEKCCELLLISNKYKAQYPTGIVISDPMVERFGVCAIRKWRRPGG